MRKLILASALITLAASASPVAAQDEAQPSGWQTWTWQGTCFAVLFPEDASISALNSERAYLAVKHDPSESIFNSVIFVSGLEDLQGYQGSADVEGRKFDLLLFDGAGFVSAGERENALISALEGADELTLTWTGPDVLTRQSYSLSGFSQAKRTIDTACGAPDDA